MKVGDLVKCPPYVNGNHAVGACAGIVLEVVGHKITVGTPRGAEMWDSCDIRTISASPARGANSAGNFSL